MSKSPHDSMMTELDPVDLQRSINDTKLKKYFQAAIKFGASDLIMRPGQKPKLRIRGKLKDVDVPPLDSDMFEHAIQDGLSPKQWERYTHEGSSDLAVDIDAPDGGDTHRFRVNIFRTRGRSGIAARLVSNTILNFEQLYLPPVMHRIANEVEQGMVLLCGVTGSGKSTTIAAMLQRINETRKCHILTIEDPIEYLFEDAKSMLNQREVGIDVPGLCHRAACDGS